MNLVFKAVKKKIAKILKIYKRSKILITLKKVANLKISKTQ